MRRNTKIIGDASEAMMLAALISAGYHVAIPFGEDQRYDMIIDKNGVLARVQVKTGRLRKGAILFNCYSVHAHADQRLRTYRCSIELFGVYCPDIKEACLVPVGDVPRSCYGSIRVVPPKSGQRSRIRWARDYRLSGSAVSAASVGAALMSAVETKSAGEPS